MNITLKITDKIALIVARDKPKIKNNSTNLAINFSNLLIIKIKEISIKDSK